jgi:hypothetical protein
MEAMPDDNVIVKLDFSNAFNSIHRDAMLQAIRSSVPEIYSFCHLSYSNSSFLKFGSRMIISDEGCQQGDPLGPLHFCTTIHPMLQSLSSELIIGYMDDITLGGTTTAVANDVNIIKSKGFSIGLNLNSIKCEKISKEEQQTTSQFNEFMHVSSDKATLLGAPLSVGSAMSAALLKKLNELRRAAERLVLVSAHDALILLRASAGAPKLMHILRSSPCTDNILLHEIDLVLRQCLCDITNVSLNDNNWKQASLPVNAGGLGIRSISAIALSAFLASEYSTQLLQNRLLEHSLHDINDYQLISLRSDWVSSHPLSPPPSGVTANKQRSWDQPGIELTFSTLLESQPDDYGKARLLAVSTAHSGDWLHALSCLVVYVLIMRRFVWQ